MKRLFLLLAFVLMFSKTWAYNFYDGWYYNLISNGSGGYDAEITYGDGNVDRYQGNRTIPEYLAGCKVTSIGEGAFRNCRLLKSVTIPSSVTTIGLSAFADCYSLTSVSIPSSVTTIGDGAFWGCFAMERIDVSDDNPSYRSENGILYLKDGSTLIMCPGSKTSVSIPSSVTTIGDDAFANCASLVSVTIPSSVISIGANAFFNCRSMTAVTIPSSVVSIGSHAFDSCRSLESVIIPGGITMVSDAAFRDCDSLASVTILDGVASIDSNAFSGCRSMTSVTIPSSVKVIGDRAFYGCTSLMSMIIPEGVTSIGSYAFWYCGLTSVIIPGSVISIGDCAFAACQLTSVIIPESVTIISNGMFSGCRLTSMIIPRSVTSIGDYAFAGCFLLASVTIPSNVISIGSGVFSGCNALTTIYVTVDDAARLRNLIGESSTDGGEWSFVEIMDNEDQLTGGSNETKFGAVHTDSVLGWQIVEHSDVRFGTTCLRGTMSEVYDEVGGSTYYSAKVRGTGVLSFWWKTLCEADPAGEYTWDRAEFWLDDVCVEKCDGVTEWHKVTVDIMGDGDHVVEWKYMTDGYPPEVDGLEGCVLIDGAFWSGKTSVIEPLANPVITPGNGATFSNDSCIVSIACETEDAAIYYSVNGRTPSVSDAFRYKGPFVISKSATIIAIAVRGDEKSEYIRSTITYEPTITLPATADYTYDGASFTHTGWFNDADSVSENFTSMGMALGPNGTKVSAVVDGHHPWTENSLPEAFTLSVYTDLSMITGASSLSKAVIWSTGDLTHNRVMLLTDGANVILSASGGDCISLPLPNPGYHLITAVFSASGIKLVIDDGIGDDRVAIHTGVYGSIAAGFQIGSVCGDLPRGYRKPIGLPIAKMVGYSKALTVAQIALLSELYPASTTAIGVVNYSVSGGMFYVGSMTHTDGRLEIDCGTLIVPDGQIYSVPALRFGNCGSNGDTLALGLELDGTLIISGGQTADGYDGDGVRSDVVNNRGGILCGEWTGRGTYNIRGILDASNSFVQLADNAYMQTWNIENGGLLKVKAIEARAMSLAKQTAHLLNVKDGGRVVSTQGFIRGKLIANVEDGGVLEIANTANVDMKDADLSGITGEGQFKISNAIGSGYTLLPSDPTKFFADTLEFVAESEFYLTAGGDFTIGSLSGTGCLNTMYNLNGVRTLTIKQSKDTTWSGDVVADWRSRLSAIKVVSENESILTLAGTNNQPYAPILLLGGGRVKTTGSGMTVASGVVGMDVKCEDEIFSLVWAISAPTIEGDAAAEVIGDTESGFVVKPSEGTIDVVVMIPEGVDAEKVTIEVSPIVQLVKANGAKIKVVKGAADITAFLDVPAAVNGVIDLSAAVVKPEVAAEAMDITKGAEITLSATNPTITTAPTKPGLTYTLVEGTTIESMGAGASKLGDGTAWTPEIKVKGGASAFYSIKVTK